MVRWSLQHFAHDEAVGFEGFACTEGKEEHMKRPNRVDESDAHSMSLAAVEDFEVPESLMDRAAATRLEKRLNDAQRPAKRRRQS